MSTLSLPAKKRAPGKPKPLIPGCSVVLTDHVTIGMALTRLRKLCQSAGRGTDERNRPGKDHPESRGEKHRRK